jgi:regulator of RNase E activity RraA
LEIDVMTSDETMLFDSLRHISTDSIAGVLLQRGLRNQWVRGPMPLRVDFPRTVGRAFTMRFIPAREDVEGAFTKRLPVNRDAVEMMPPGCIAIADARGTRDAATFGDIVVERMVKRGVAGIVTDGAVRDRAGLLASKMPIWTSGITSPPPAASLMLAEWQQPIGCGGVAVFPEDIIVADADGVMVIPQALLEEVVVRGMDQEHLDKWQMDQIKRGVALPDLKPMPRNEGRSSNN